MKKLLRGHYVYRCQSGTIRVRYWGDHDKLGRECIEWLDGLPESKRHHLIRSMEDSADTLADCIAKLAGVGMWALRMTIGRMVALGGGATGFEYSNPVAWCGTRLERVTVLDRPLTDQDSAADRPSPPEDRASPPR